MTSRQRVADTAEDLRRAAQQVATIAAVGQYEHAALLVRAACLIEELQAAGRRGTKMPCPECSNGRTVVVEIRRDKAGPTRRRHQCSRCQTRWTSWDGVLGHQSIVKPARVLPEPEAGAPSCTNCTHWDGKCGMGFPDPLEEGPGFAADCSLYAP